jgi:hypothetical protein
MTSEQAERLIQQVHQIKVAVALLTFAVAFGLGCIAGAIMGHVS